MPDITNIQYPNLHYKIVPTLVIDKRILISIIGKLVLVNTRVGKKPKFLKTLLRGYGIQFKSNKYT